MNRVIEWLLGIKPGELAGADWEIGLVAEHGNYINLALMLALAAMVFLIVRSYRREGDAPRRTKTLLAAVRIAVVALVFVVLFRPAVVLHLAKTLHSVVVVLIDDSLSMSCKDRYGGQEVSALRKRLADRLGVAEDELADLSRMEIVHRSLAREGGPMEKLAGDHPLVVMRYSTTQPGRESYTRPLGETINVTGGADADSPARRKALADEFSAMFARLTAGGFETNIPAAIRQALEAVQGRRVAGIVLVSDGQITTPDATGRLMGARDYAAARPVPLYAVIVGDPTPPANVAVVALQAPREVRRGGRAEFTAVLTHRNLAGRGVNVRLMCRESDRDEWTDTTVSERVTLVGPGGKAAPPGHRSVQSVTMHLEPDRLGRFIYKAVVEPLPGEQNIDDNAAEAVVRVSDEKINVLLISGDSGHEFQYLRNFLIRQPELYRVSVWQQNLDEDMDQVASAGMKLARLPRTLKELIGDPEDDSKPGYRVVILYDPEPTREGFDGKFVEMLKRFVEQHNGGLCYIAGNKYSDSTLHGTGTMKPLADLLPVTLAADTMRFRIRIEQRMPVSWRMSLTAYGVDHPVMRLGADAEQTQRIWNILPGVFWSHPVFGLKPAARVLAENSLRQTAGGRYEPLVAAQAVGGGRVVYVGTDETWRWRFVADGAYHRKFWGNLVRYLAPLEARQVVITSGGDRFTAGEKITIEAEAYDKDYRPLTDETFSVEMINVKTREARTISLKAVEVNKSPGRYKGTVTAAHTGTYELTAMRGDPQARRRVASKRITIELPRGETLRTEADRTTMETVASHPDYFLDICDADKLPELIPPGRLRVSRRINRELWDSKFALGLIVVLLTVEWILRKKYNMA